MTHVALGLCATAMAGGVRNGDFGIGKGSAIDAERMKNIRAAGWTCPDPANIPHDWAPNPSTRGGTLETFKTGGFRNTSYVRLDGNAHISSFYGKVGTGYHVMSLWTRGKGNVGGGFYEYIKNEKGQTAFDKTQVVVSPKVDSDVWVNYRGLWQNHDGKVVSINTAIWGKGPIDVDHVTFEPVGPGEATLVAQLQNLYGSGALVEDQESVLVDKAVMEKAEQMKAALATLSAKAADNPKIISPEALGELRERTDALLKLMSREGGAIRSGDYNDMIALIAVFNKLAGKKTAPPKKAEVKAAPKDEYRAGIREPQPDAVTIAKIRPNKILYDQGENARVTVTLVNTTDQPQKGELVCEQRWDIDERQALASRGVNVPANGTKDVVVKYNVGPDGFGREFAARFVQGGKTVDAWSEFYSAMDEWMRVHMLVGGPLQGSIHDTSAFDGYGNHKHFFAHMPSDFGYGAPKENMWLAGQTRYRVKKALMKGQTKHYQRQGMKVTWYVNACYGGQAGFEIMRRHPEWNTYGPNGQPAEDPIYGGNPDPLELASPIEIDPKVVGEDTRKISSWYHGTCNFYDMRCLAHGVDEIIKSTEMFGWDGVFWDGHWSIRHGLDYTGQIVSRGEDREALNERNVKYVVDQLHARYPNYATWYNWSTTGLEFHAEAFGMDYLAGDAQFTAAASAPNSCMLIEARGQDRPNTRMANYKYHYDMLVENRDWVVQDHGSVHDQGFLWWSVPDEANPSRWGWVMHNHLAAQMAATQTHPVVLFNPAWRPTLQLLTRYSRLIWARDIKTIPEPERFIQVTSSRPVWWKEVAYERETPGGKQYILHLLNEPETETMDLEYPTPPPNVSAKVSLNLPSGQTAAQAWMVRPYDFDEPQQPVQMDLKVVKQGATTTIDVPAFPYYAIIVIRAEHAQL